MSHPVRTENDTKAMPRSKALLTCPPGLYARYMPQGSYSTPSRLIRPFVMEQMS